MRIWNILTFLARFRDVSETAASVAKNLSSLPPILIGLSRAPLMQVNTRRDSER